MRHPSEHQAWHPYNTNRRPLQPLMDITLPPVKPVYQKCSQMDIPLKSGQNAIETATRWPHDMDTFSASVALFKRIPRHTHDLYRGSLGDFLHNRNMFVYGRIWIAIINLGLITDALIYYIDGGWGVGGAWSQKLNLPTAMKPRYKPWYISIGTNKCQYENKTFCMQYYHINHLS